MNQSIIIFISNPSKEITTTKENYRPQILMKTHGKLPVSTEKVYTITHQKEYPSVNRFKDVSTNTNLYKVIMFEDRNQMIWIQHQNKPSTKYFQNESSEKLGIERT